jgi:acetyltransferase-like isoleucine patch superfamily enzyme
MNGITQVFLRRFRPWFYALLTRIVYSDKSIEFGKKFRCDGIPRILIDPGCKLAIGNEVEFRRNVEIRIHQGAQIIIGSNIRLDRGVRILSTNNSVIKIEDFVRIGLYTVMNGGADISIGQKSLVSGFVYLQTSMHGYADREMTVQDQGYVHAPVMLGEDVWLGAGSVILPGVVIGKGAVIGSNAVVTKEVAPFKVVAGIPARELKERT